MRIAGNERGAAAPDAAADGPRLGADDRIERFVRSPAGALIARPWFDSLALLMLARFYFPLSRLWAAAGVAEGSVARFAEAAPIRRLSGSLAARTGRALAEFERTRTAARAAEARWEGVFFGGVSGNRESHSELVALEAERQRFSHAHMASRSRFSYLLPVRRVPLVRWEVPSPDALAAAYGEALARPEAAYAPPESMPTVERSRAVPGPGWRASWLRYRSPSPRLGDVAYAKVYEPESATDPPTLIFGHGVCVETDQWRGVVDSAIGLCRQGIRVIEPTAPWHGRRTPAGWYGGEPFIGRGPIGALDLFTGLAREMAVLIDWCRRMGGGPVAVGGVSMGALVGQLVCVHARDWPARLRPDAALLVTHSGRIEDVTRAGALAKSLGLAGALAAAGWRGEHFARLRALTDPEGPPGIAPARIVTVLGRADRVTPFAGGKALSERWGLPADNVFVLEQGHFGVPLALLRDSRPFERFAAVLRS